MNKDTVFSRTHLGNQLLDKPQGRISGDELLMLALIDGVASVELITSKVPPSVRSQLDAMFSRMLAMGYIDESGHAADTGLPREDRTVLGNTQDAADRCAALEQELGFVRAQLEALRARQKDIEVGFHKLRLRVSAYVEIRQARMTRKLRDFSEKNYSQQELVASCENDLKTELESLKPLNDAIAEQQQLFFNTLRLKLPNGESGAYHAQGEGEAEAPVEVYGNPDYKRLRGLEFFRAFENAELLKFLEIAKWMECAPGDVILNEGDVGMPFYIIVTGSVVVSKGGRQLNTLEHGEFFGEFAYLSGEQPYRSARVVAQAPCELLMVDPLDIEFAPIKLRLHVVEALLRGQIRRMLVSYRSTADKHDADGPDELDYTAS